MNWECNSTITANADIAGPGIIVSFVLVAWISIFANMVLAFYDLLEFLSCAKRWKWRSSTSISGILGAINHLRRTTQLRKVSNLDRTSLLRETASNLLEPLCDLQIVTSLAIVVAGLAQIWTLSLYHESLAISYWMLTLNSFWITGDEDINQKTVQYTGKVTIRRIGVLVNVVLGLTLCHLLSHRESREWFFLQPEHCYLSHDYSSGLIWVVGTYIYAVSLCLIIIPASRPWVYKYKLFTSHMQANLVEGWKKHVNALQTCYFQCIASNNLCLVHSLLHIVFRMARFILYSLCLMSYCLWLQFMAIWSFGDGFYPLHILAHLGFGIWSTFGILDLKLSNQSLIVGQEKSWGFGQILPMVLLVTIGYNAFNAFRGKSLCPGKLDL